MLAAELAQPLELNPRLRAQVRRLVRHPSREAASRLLLAARDAYLESSCAAPTTR